MTLEKLEFEKKRDDMRHALQARFEHPMGSYFSRAKIGNGFFFTNDCVVLATSDGVPIIGNNVLMKFGSSVIGNSIIGNNCIIEEGAVIKNQNIVDNSVVSGKSPDITITPIPIDG